MDKSQRVANYRPLAFQGSVPQPFFEGGIKGEIIMELSRGDLFSRGFNVKGVTTVVPYTEDISESQQTGVTMNQFEILMKFTQETRDSQQKYLETIKAENAALIERNRSESLNLTARIQKDLSDFRTETKSELSSVRRWYASTIITIIIGSGAIIYSIWATALQR
ncbi:MAG: hypothetical protein NTW27_14260 [Deltaproteobacteria bacterium]|jgi:hypothetical protein|nr:hypothetical protein [Deltaproteobacteria bacterium]